MTVLNKPLSGKIIFVTGEARSIGAAIVRRLASEGHPLPSHMSARKIKRKN
jgi:NADP-dependent 3-hydroxy acid dehydrogenase YdfG